MFDCSLLTDVDFVFKYNDFWNDNSNKCDSCDNSFENNINLSQNIKNFHNHRKRYTDVIFALGNCFDRKKQLQIYTNNFHKALKCNYCEKLFTHAGHREDTSKIFMKVMSMKKKKCQAVYTNVKSWRGVHTEQIISEITEGIFKLDTVWKDWKNVYIAILRQRVQKT